jgi:hypothetical protein
MIVFKIISINRVASKQIHRVEREVLSFKDSGEVGSDL